MLVKQGIDVSFAEGLDTKTDPKRVQMGKFASLRNRVFNKGGLLEKRNGYGRLSDLPDTSYSYVTTFNGNLTAVGTNIAAYNAGASSWVSRGTLQPASIDTLPVIRNNLNQTSCDIAIASNGIGCCVYLESNGSTTTNKYVIFDSVTGQNLKAPAVIPVSSGTVTGGMRVYVLGNNFVMMFTNVITAVSHLQFVTVSIQNPSVVGANTDIAAAYISAATLSWDAAPAGNSLYIAYNTTTGGQQIKVTSLTVNGTVTSPVSFATYKATAISVSSDLSNESSPVIYVNFYRSDTESAYSLAVNTSLNTIMSPQTVFTSQGCSNITSAAQNGVCSIFFEGTVNYTWSGTLGPTIPTHNLLRYTATAATSTIGAGIVSIRSLGIASKAFVLDGVIYLLGAFQSTYQPSYFLINGSSSTSASPVIVGKLAYENGGGYLPTGIPNVSVNGSTAQFAYLFKDLIQAVNKNTDVPAGSQTAGIYSQTGVNLASFTFGTDGLDTAEIGGDLHLSGGLLWMYDGYLPVEHGFLLYPDSYPGDADQYAWSTTGGSIVAKPDGSTNTNAYYYQFTYEWTDNQGNAFRSAPSIPIAVTTSGSGTTGSITLKIPSLRVTMKTSNAVKIVVYRWSVAQQVYYQTSSITTPTLNDTTADTITFVDTNSDATILGNNILYTTGGVIENTAAPGTDLLALFDTRLWLVDAENQNLLWFSKQVVQSTPVEMSDLLTVYVPPTTSTHGSTGPIRSIAVMDDKLIIGKTNAFLYINGNGPDNTGANNQYSQPIFITATVGCDNQKSIVLTPKGLMFQSNKGIWLLDRGLGTTYIGAPVEDLTTGALVNSAVLVPETNQVRFTLDTGITLMYDYYYDQWGEFTGVPCLSSCIYQDLHSFVNQYGAVYQETIGSYVDGSNPVLQQFKTGPLRLGDLQNYQRAYFFYLLGTYLSPHKLYVRVYYDYDEAPSQSFLIEPTNYSTPYGSGASQSPYGQGDPYGGPGNAENWRVFLERQRCMAFAIEVQEIFDSSFGEAPGAGFTLSGINVICAFKKAFRPQPNVNSIG